MCALFFDDAHIDDLRAGIEEASKRSSMSERPIALMLAAVQHDLLMSTRPCYSSMLPAEFDARSLAQALLADCGSAGVSSRFAQKTDCELAKVTESTTQILLIF